MQQGWSFKVTEFSKLPASSGAETSCETSPSLLSSEHPGKNPPTHRSRAATGQDPARNSHSPDQRFSLQCWLPL